MSNIIWSNEFIVDETRLKVSKCGQLMRFSRGKWKLTNLKPDKHGYKRLSTCRLINIKSKPVHRLIYKGFNPNWDIYNNSRDNSIDHINEDKSNNALGNLRLSSHSENLCNKGAHKNNRTKMKNIHVNYINDTWCYCLQIQKKGFKPVKRSIIMGYGMIPDDYSVENYPIPQELIDLLIYWLPIMHGKFTKHSLIPA